MLGEGCKGVHLRLLPGSRTQLVLQQSSTSMQSAESFTVRTGQKKLSGQSGSCYRRAFVSDELSTSITQCIAKAMEHLSDLAFVSMANVTS